MLLKKYLEKLDRSYSKHKFRKVSCNSKKIKNGDVFFAINGHTNNGNLFINDAIKNGAKTIISDNNFSGYKKECSVYKKQKSQKVTSN
jgi:UDP-N-acetylmuramyl tripeptide synthase